MSRNWFSSFLRRIFLGSHKSDPRKQPKTPKPKISSPYNIKSSAPIKTTDAPRRRKASICRYSCCRPTRAEERPCSELSMTCVGIDSLMCSEGQELELPGENRSVPSVPQDTRRRGTGSGTGRVQHEQCPPPREIVKANKLCTGCAKFPPKNATGLCKKCSLRPESLFTISAYGRDSFCYTKPETKPMIDSPTLPFERFFKISECESPRSPLNDDEGNIDFRSTYYAALYNNWIASDVSYTMQGGRQ